MYRARFMTSADDPRPVQWPIELPYWVSGQTGEGGFILVAYVKNEEQLLKQWPEAEDIDMGDEVTEVKFSERFSKPDWFTT